MNLRDYEQAKFHLAELLRASGASDSRLPQPVQSQIRELFARLAEDRFNLVVVGRFSRGKTSLMNAVLGTDRLPTGIRPLTSVITTVTYGSAERAIIHFAGGGLPRDIALAALPEYITEQGNSENHRRVSLAQVQLPVELLRRGFHFIDTPGLGSPIVENTRTTERFLPEADAFVLVTSFEGPLSEEEVGFLRGASAAGQPAFVVVNKQDMATPTEREDALNYLREQLRDVFGGRGLGVFAVSARDGLAAKQRGDAAALAESGIAAFEAELVHYLLTEKSREFLTRMSDRIAAVLAGLPRRPEVTKASERLAALARRIGGARAPSAPSAPRDKDDAAMPAPSRPCEICAHVVDRCFDFLRHFQYEITVSPERQEQLAGRGGLCSFHTWIYAQLASPQGICAGYAGVLDRWAARLQRSAAAAIAPDATEAPANGRYALEAGPCPVCDARKAAESAAVDRIVGRLQQRPDSIAALSELCLPHFRLLAMALSDGPLKCRLLARQGVRLQRMAEDMRRYLLKRDGLRQYLASDEEEKAAEQALTMLAGHRTLNTPIPWR